MGIREYLAKAFRLGTPGQGITALDFVEMNNPPSWTYQNYLQAYGQVGWVFVCVNVIAEAVARNTWHLYELDKDNQRTEIFEHELLDLFEQFNPFQSRYQFLYLSTVYKKLVGESFWQMNFNGKKQPAEIWLAPPAYMSVIPDPDRYIKGYEFKRPGMSQPIPFTIDEIIHIMTPNPNNPYRGLSEAQALTQVVDSERYAAAYTQKTFYNEAVPKFVVEYPAEGMPNFESRKELVQEWDERYKGFRNSQKTGFLWGGKINQVVMSNTDMDFAALRAFSRDTILAVYKVPHSVIGITDHTARAGAEATNYAFSMYAVHPELAALRECLNKELVPFFGDNLYLDFENPIPEDAAASVNNAVNLFKSGIITRNDALRMIDMEPLETPEGEEYFTQPQGFGAVMPNMPGDNTPSGDIAGNKTVKKKYSSEQKETYWKDYVSKTEAYEARFIADLKTIFLKLKTEALDRFNANPTESVKLWDKTTFKALYKEKATPTLRDCLAGAISNGRQLLEPVNPHKDIPQVVNPYSLQWLLTRITWAANEIGDESEARLSKILYDGFKAGDSTHDIAKRIQDEFDNYFSASRSELIARTETQMAASQGTLTGYKEMGVAKSEFYTATDERTCDDCNSFHEQEFPIDDARPMIPLHPRCRCVWLPVIPERN